MKACPTTLSRRSSIRLARSSANGASDLPLPECPAWRRSLEAGVEPAFPPSLVVQVKALACELPHRLGLPCSRLPTAETRKHVISQGLVAESTAATFCRGLTTIPSPPGHHRIWISPPDPTFP